MDLENLFTKSASFIKTKIGMLSESDVLEFYGLYKQAREGPCTITKPSFLQFSEKAKWYAWRNQGDKSKEDAMAEYMQKVEDLYPEWSDEESPRTKLAWVHHSSHLNDEPELNDNVKTIWDFVKENNSKSLLEALAENDIAMVDEDGLTLLHWAVDRGHLTIVKELLAYSNGMSLLNVRDAEGQTPLHYAAQCGYPEIVLELIRIGAKLDIPDSDGLLPKDVACNNEISRLFV